MLAILIKNLLLGLQKKGDGGAASRDMSFHERKKAVRHAADAALAAARGDATCWSRSLAAELDLARRPSSRPVVRLSISSAASSECRPRKATTTAMMRQRILRSCRRRILRRARWSKKSDKGTATKAAAGILAREMVRRRRTRALREMVPGGRAMDERTLLGETLDYAVSLKAQVDAMQLLVRALQAPNNN